MPPHFMPFANPTWFVSEFVYTAIIVTFCVLIYSKTRDMYTLTKYKGIQYFRNAFLLFGLAYATRFVVHLFTFSTRTLNIFIPMRELMRISLILTTFFSTMAILLLVYSTMWKRVKEKHFSVFSISIAVFLSLVTLINRSPEMLALAQLILLAFAVLFSYSQKKKFSQTRVLYFLMLIFWLFSVFLLGPGRLIPFEAKIIFQVISLAIFFIIYHKVTKWAK